MLQTDTPDPIRAACEAAAGEILARIRSEPYPTTEDFGVMEHFAGRRMQSIIDRHMRGPITDRERRAVEALREFDRGQCFCAQIEAYCIYCKARAALALYDTPR